MPSFHETPRLRPDSGPTSFYFPISSAPRPISTGILPVSQCNGHSARSCLAPWTCPPRFQDPDLPRFPAPCLIVCRQNAGQAGQVGRCVSTAPDIETREGRGRCRVKTPLRHHFLTQWWMRPPKTFRAPRAFRGPTPIRNQESKIRNPLTRHSGRCFFLPGRPTARALRRRLGFGLAVPTGRCCFPDVFWQGSMSFSPEASREVCMAQNVLSSRRHRRDGPMLPKVKAGDQEKSGQGQVEILDFRFWILDWLVRPLAFVMECRGSHCAA